MHFKCLLYGSMTWLMPDDTFLLVLLSLTGDPTDASLVASMKRICIVCSFHLRDQVNNLIIIPVMFFDMRNSNKLYFEREHFTKKEVIDRWVWNCPHRNQQNQETWEDKPAPFLVQYLPQLNRIGNRWKRNPIPCETRCFWSVRFL